MGNQSLQGLRKTRVESVCFVLSKEFTTTCPETEIPKLQCGYNCRIEVVPLREVPVFTQITQQLVKTGRGNRVQQPVGGLQQRAVELYSYRASSREGETGLWGWHFTCAGVKKAPWPVLD